MYGYPVKTSAIKVVIIAQTISHCVPINVAASGDAALCIGIENDGLQIVKTEISHHGMFSAPQQKYSSFFTILIVSWKNMLSDYVSWTEICITMVR